MYTSVFVSFLKTVVSSFPLGNLLIETQKQNMLILLKLLSELNLLMIGVQFLHDVIVWLVWLDIYVCVINVSYQIYGEVFKSWYY